MLNISGSLEENSEVPVLDRERELLVSSCGHYKLLHRQRFTTVRPQGRPDYQLLYVAGGCAEFSTAAGTGTVAEGGAVLYRPGEPQQYTYELADRPDVYWIHFFGRDIEGLLRELRLFEEPVMRLPPGGEYAALFDRIIRELQLKRENHRRLCSLYGLELLTLLSRQRQEWQARPQRLCEPVERAIRLFHTRYGEPLELTAYARECGVSPCWFNRLFRRQTGQSPGAYLTAVRMGKARELLTCTDYPVGEVAALTGYPNPLYFSRIFKKNAGLSPSEYRRAYQPALPGEAEDASGGRGDK